MAIDPLNHTRVRKSYQFKALLFDGTSETATVTGERILDAANDFEDSDHMEPALNHVSEQYTAVGQDYEGWDILQISTWPSFTMDQTA